MELWLKVFEVILPVIIIVITGYVFGRLTNVNLKPINLLLLYISTPCLIFSSLIDGKVTLSDAYQILISGTVMIFLSIIIGACLLKLFKIDSRPFFFPIHIMPPYYENCSLPVSEKLSLLLLDFGSAFCSSHSLQVFLN